MSKRTDKPTLAVVLMMIVALLAAMDATIVRLLANQVHPFVIGFFRSLFGLLAVLPLISRVDLAGSPYRWLHAIRAGMKLLALVSFFVAFANAPLAEVTAISFTTPIFLTLGGWLLLRERMVISHALALLVGFGGMLVVMQPGSGRFSIALLFAVAGALITASIQLILKRMSARDTTERLVAWNLLTIVPIALLPAIIFWTTPTLSQLGLLILQGLLGLLNMTLVTRALSIAGVSLIAPLDFLRLPLVAALAYFMFGEIPEASTWIGAAVIFGATLLVAGSTRFIRREQTDLQ